MVQVSGYAIIIKKIIIQFLPYLDLRADLTAQRPITKRELAKERKQTHRPTNKR
jgi:hypothetical protein